jgi:1-deoxy-D-xylulose-5-phosphate reductoisomerase
MTKNIAILGSTGSIGTSALRVIRSLGPEYRVAAISAHNNVELLAQHAREFAPDYVALTNPDKLPQLKSLLGRLKTEILAGPEVLVDLATLDGVDMILTAVVGAAGLPGVLAAAQKGKTLAIANKEPLVIAGELLTRTAAENNASIIPVDSEHSAIFQAMQAGRANEVNKIILTASGGPFLNTAPEQIASATIDDALAHPTWSMGKKITIDSATMMNKALEIIEARWLFNVSIDRIDVMIHPESVVHSLVEFVDGSVIAQLGTPDMCLPIQYALTYPRRLKGISEKLRLDSLGKLTFRKPDLEKFRALALGFEVARTGRTAPAVFNAANEVAVEAFLEGRIGFADITILIEQCLESHVISHGDSLENLLEADAWARNEVNKCLKTRIR